MRSDQTGRAGLMPDRRFITYRLDIHNIYIYMISNRRDSDRCKGRARVLSDIVRMDRIESPARQAVGTSHIAAFESGRSLPNRAARTFTIYLLQVVILHHFGLPIVPIAPIGPAAGKGSQPVREQPNHLAPPGCKITSFRASDSLDSSDRSRRRVGRPLRQSRSGPRCVPSKTQEIYF